MEYLWHYIEKQPWRAGTKYYGFFWALGVLSGLAGLLLWCVVRLWVLQTMVWALCFIGCAVVAGWLAAVCYSVRHDFHSR